ncbi:MAG: SDR family NAD(P)-dependent oxidoreductase [Pseudomonadales bacterium]
MTYIIVGSSSGLGRALAQRFALAGNEIVLISRDTRDTQALASDLQIRYGVKVSALKFDLNVEYVDCGPIDDCLSGHAPLAGLLLPVGINADEDCVGQSNDNLHMLNRVNYLSPCQLVNHYLATIEAAGGAIVGFGSVATARGRSRNSAYAAAKRGLESYFESLQHHAAQTGFTSAFYVLGYLDTNLAFSQNLPFPVASPEKVADVVFKQIGKGGKRFLPWPWYFLYRVVQLLPWAIFKRMSF